MAGRLALLELLERKLIDNVLLNEWICPLIAHQAMTTAKNEDRRIESFTLMCQTASVVGKELTMKCFLEPFCSMAMDAPLTIRKNCAYKFGEFCEVVGTEVSEEILLPKFLDLCQADQWGIRKACAETFVDVALITPAKKPMLTNVFIRLLCDESRWVRFSAYQSLGRFISTFADLKMPGLQYNEDGALIFKRSCDEVSEPPPCDSKNFMYEDYCEESTFGTSSSNSEKDEAEKLCHSEDAGHCSSNDSSTNFTSNTRPWWEAYTQEPLTSQIGAVPGSGETTTVNVLSSARTSDRIVRSDSPMSVVAKGGHLHVHLDNDSVFNNFQFWRLPLPEIEVDVDIENGQATSIHVRAKTRDERTNQICASDFRVDISSHRLKCEEPQKMTVDTSQESGDDNAEVTRPVAEVVETLVKSASVSTVDTTSPATDSEPDPQKSGVIQSSFDEAHLTIVDGELKELKQSHNDLCSPDQKFNNYNPFEVTTIYPKSAVLSDEYINSYNQIQYPGVYEQDIVPPELLLKYITMVEPVLSHVVDSEITRYCAFSLPAVAYTLGQKNWVCLSKLCELLASDMQWKVRRTIAASLHVLAAILGSEIAGNELLQLFFSLINDLDEVRASIVQNLSEFLKHLHYKNRKQFLPQLKKFLKMDNEHNWRFRHTLVKQLIPLTRLYSHSDVQDYIYPVAMFLIRDRVCEVRLETMRLIAVILSKLSGNATTVRSVLKDLQDKFCNSHKWLWRQTYVLICQQLAIDHSLSTSVYAQHIAENMLTLAWDSVPNVRLAVARCLEAIPLDYLNEIERCQGELLTEVISLLQEDVDRDVRSFASMSLIATTIMHEMLSPV